MRRGGGLKGEEVGRQVGRWSGGEKKKNGSYGQTVLFKVVTVIGVGVRKMKLKEMRKHNV